MIRRTIHQIVDIYIHKIVIMIILAIIIITTIAQS